MLYLDIGQEVHTLSLRYACSESTHRPTSCWTNNHFNYFDAICIHMYRADTGFRSQAWERGCHSQENHRSGMYRGGGGGGANSTIERC